MLFPTTATLFASILAIGAACPVHPATSTAAPPAPPKAIPTPAPANAAAAPANANCPIALSSDKILAVAPPSRTCAANLPECRTAAQATEPIAKSFATYQICDPSAQAALVATMALESANFQYSHNVSPGRPGQGTRSMMMPNFVLQYAAALKVGGGGDAAATLKLLQANPEWDFGSAAWYLSSQSACQGARDLFRQKSPQAWPTYVTQCLGTTMSPERTEYHERALKAFGISA